MKTKLHILIGLFFLSTMSMKGQITLEHIVPAGVPYFYMTYIDSNESKYVMLDKVNNSFSLYNMDMSPFLTDVHIPVTQDSIANGFGPIYISRRLLDCDSATIEYVYQTPYDVYHKFRIFRTDGTLLFERDSCNGPYYWGGILGGSVFGTPIQNTSAGAKLFLQQYDSLGIPQTLIYGLCGSLPVSSFDLLNHGESSSVKIYPNPTSQELNFEVMTPNNQDEFKITIFDSQSKMQKTQTMQIQQGKCTLNVGAYSSGLYTYTLSGKNKTYQTGKFILTK